MKVVPSVKSREPSEPSSSCASTNTSTGSRLLIVPSMESSRRSCKPLSGASGGEARSHEMSKLPRKAHHDDVPASIQTGARRREPR